MTDRKDGRHRPHRGKAAQAFSKRSGRNDRTRLGLQPDVHANRDRVAERCDDSRNQRGQEQLADRLLRDDAVDHQDQRRRDQDAQRSAGGQRTRCQRPGITRAPHLGQRHRGHRRSGRDRGPADGAERGAPADCRDGQPAAAMPHPGAGRVEQGSAEPGASRQLAHQQEQRQHRKRVARHPAERRGVQQIEERRPSRDGGEAEAADQEHRHRDRHPQCDQHQADAEQEPAVLDVRHRLRARSLRLRATAQTTVSNTAPSSAGKYAQWSGMAR